jgi:hypothetical protein
MNWAPPLPPTVPAGPADNTGAVFGVEPGMWRRRPDVDVPPLTAPAAASPPAAPAETVPAEPPPDAPLNDVPSDASPLTAASIWPTVVPGR